MIIKPYAGKLDLWFRIKQPRIGDVDKADIYFGLKGEFSPSNDIAFEKHIKRLGKLAREPFYKNMNGGRVKAIARAEPLWYMIFMIIGASFLL